MSLGQRLLDPAPLWDKAAQELARRPRALGARVLQVAVLAAAGAALVADFAGDLLTTRTSVEFGFLARPHAPLQVFLSTFLGVLASPFLLAAAFVLLARAHRLPFRPLAAFAVAVYGALPVYATLLLVWVPAAMLLVCAALIVSLLWWAAGCRRLLAVPPGDSAEFLGLAALGTLLATQLLGALLATIL